MSVDKFNFVSPGVFIDEIDAIGAKRLDSATSGDREVQRTLMQLLAELDGFDSLEDVKIIAATNRPDILDDALLRPGRFDRVIEIPLPDETGRKTILSIHFKNLFSISSLVKLTFISPLIASIIISSLSFNKPIIPPTAASGPT